MWTNYFYFNQETQTSKRITTTKELIGSVKEGGGPTLMSQNPTKSAPHQTPKYTIPNATGEIDANLHIDDAFVTSYHPSFCRTTFRCFTYHFSVLQPFTGLTGNMFSDNSVMISHWTPDFVINNVACNSQYKRLEATTSSILGHSKK